MSIFKKEASSASWKEIERKNNLEINRSHPLPPERQKQIERAIEEEIFSMMQEKYNMKYAVAAVRGRCKRIGNVASISEELLQKPLCDLSHDEQMELIGLGERAGLKLYYFKSSDRQLPRVHKVLGFLKSICFETLLDVGSGRGVFLLPFLDEFPYIQVSSIDVLDKRVELLSDLANGGVDTLRVEKADLCSQPYADHSFDVVTLLEVLEHIPDVEAAIRAAVRMAKKFVVVTVPSKEDDNPEHIHLLTKDKLTAYFTACGVKKLSFDGVPGHLFMIANVEEV